MRTRAALLWALSVSGLVILAGPQSWPWWLMLAPLLVPVAVFVVALLMGMGLHAALVCAGLWEAGE